MLAVSSATARRFCVCSEIAAYYLAVYEEERLKQMSIEGLCRGLVAAGLSVF